MHACFNSGCYRTDMVSVKVLRLKDENSSANEIVRVQEGHLDDRSFEDSKASLSSDTSNQDLHNLSQAHLLDRTTIPEYLWRQGTLYVP
jgi:hypothetical protein